jgi:hypothetical protein
LHLSLLVNDAPGSALASNDQQMDLPGDPLNYIGGIFGGGEAAIAPQCGEHKFVSIEAGSEKFLSKLAFEPFASRGARLLTRWRCDTILRSAPFQGGLQKLRLSKVSKQ